MLFRSGRHRWVHGRLRPARRGAALRPRAARLQAAPRSALGSRGAGLGAPPAARALTRPADPAAAPRGSGCSRPPPPRADRPPWPRSEGAARARRSGRAGQRPGRSECGRGEAGLFPTTPGPAVFARRPFLAPRTVASRDRGGTSGRAAFRRLGRGLRRGACAGRRTGALRSRDRSTPDHPSPSCRRPTSVDPVGAGVGRAGRRPVGRMIGTVGEDGAGRCAGLYPGAKRVG